MQTQRTHVSMADITQPYPKVDHIKGPVSSVAYPPDRGEYFYSHNRFCMVGNRLLYVDGSWYAEIVSRTDLLPEDAEHVRHLLEAHGSELTVKDCTLSSAIEWDHCASTTHSGRRPDDHPCKTVPVIGAWIQAFGPLPSGFIGHSPTKVFRVRPFSE